MRQHASVTLLLAMLLGHCAYNVQACLDDGHTAACDALLLIILMQLILLIQLILLTRLSRPTLLILLDRLIILTPCPDLVVLSRLILSSC